MATTMWKNFNQINILKKKLHQVIKDINYNQNSYDDPNLTQNSEVISEDFD